MAGWAAAIAALLALRAWNALRAPLMRGYDERDGRLYRVEGDLGRALRIMMLPEIAVKEALYTNAYYSIPAQLMPGVRDYIHVMDLAEGHRAALDCLLAEPPQMLTLNLGSGRGASVLELVHAFEEATGCAIPYVLVDRRPGDAASTVADPALAAERLGWRTRRSLTDICRDGWAWQSSHPSGYATPA